MLDFTFNSTVGSVEINVEEVNKLINHFTFHISEEDVEQCKNVFPIGELQTVTNLEGKIINYFCPLIYSEKQLQFPTGLLPSILKKVEDKKFRFHKEYKPAKLKENHELNSLLREEQKQYVNAAIKNKRGYLTAYTSFGKSYCISEILNHFTEDTVRLILVPNINLLYQFQKDIMDYLNKTEDEIGLIGDNNFRIKPITVCIPNTIFSRLKTDQEKEIIDYLNTVEVLIVDEMHMHCNNTSVTTIKHCINADYKLGTSATPSVPFNWFNEAIYGNNLVKFEQKLGIEKNYIEDPKILFIEAPGAFCSPAVLNKLRSRYSHRLYNISYRNLIVKNSGRNNLIVDITEKLVKLEEGPVVILCKRIEHAELLRREILDRDITVHYLDGKVKGYERTKILEDVQEYKVEVIISSESIISTGSSIPSLAGAINASAGTNSNLVIQKLGRLVRNRNQNLRPYFIDFTDKSYFESQSNKRLAVCEENYDYVKTIKYNQIDEHL